ncbi:S49 family peptidase [Brevundimonas sp. NIBR10]|uniref:S49 family peptidase n=1 Tax=Brevundimonas sp. NIBR10 TaxID=3015997 RepID=UPI0022F15F41|nr:S49 family peptidase [Brevundimonas sp. NIBR10]
MRNPARLAAALSGRPLLMREASVPALARMLGVEAGERGSPLATFVGRARRAFAGREDQQVRTEPLATAPRWVGEPDATGSGWVLKDGVGILEIEGPLMAEGFGWGETWYHGYDTLYRAYEEMFADARVGAIWEVVRSPGGVVDAGLPELAAFKRANRDAAGGKPIHAFLRDGYSAAYWEPSASDRIVAARESGVGSIGAVVTWCGMAGALEKDGLEIRAFTFGKRKADASPFAPLSETAEASLQAEIDQCGRWFVADVLAGRPTLTEEAVLATEAGCFFGDSDNPALSALHHGLVDEIATERTAFAAIRDLAAARLSTSPAPNRAPAATKDTDMKRSAVMAAARKAGLSKDQIRKLGAELPEDEAPADEDEGEDDEVSDQDETDEEATSDAADGDEDEEGEVDAKVAKAILNHPEAKGREDMAQDLAFTPGITEARAVRLLSKAPKGAGKGQLASVLAGSQRLGPDADTGKDKGPASASSTWAKNRPAARR